jgi:carboxyl-terminal processing protease
VTTAVIGVALLTVTFTVAWPQEVYERLALFTEVLSDIQKEYVVEVDSTKLMHDATVGMLTHLNGNNEVIDRAHATGDRAGSADVGLVVTRRGDDLTVVTSTEGSSARHAGLASGDQIEKIDGVDTRMMENAEAVDRLRGRAGTTVAVTIMRRGWAEPRDITLTRERVNGPALSSRDLGNGLVLVRVHRMTAGLGDALRRELSGSTHAALVLDLRDVSGGDISDAVNLAQPLLDPGTEVAYATGRQAGARDEFRTSTSGTRLELPTAVLVNTGTSGAAEIVAGALRDWRRAVLVGEHTFGVADVTKNIPLSDGSLVRLTVGRYYTPKGEAIDRAGVAPDFTVASETGPSAKDAQLERATDVLKIEHVIETHAATTQASR